MKKIATFIIHKRIFILILMLIITSICGYLSFKVSINSDMTKYLPDDSSMKLGMDIMESEFPNSEDAYTIRVMYENLSETQKIDIKTQLSQITNVESVTYEIDNIEYNKDQYTLYVVNSNNKYNSSEKDKIEEDISKIYSENLIEIKNNNTTSESIPTFVIFIAFAIMMIILFISCKSFIEPFLFLFTIGFAIVINLGTNILLGEISEITFGIAAILQLVLSMDYSIILMNRYRQELKLNDNHKEAMISALNASFSSITSSSITTIVGLLILIFMSFKIGADLGIVLAKGVLCSLLCVFLILPTLILLFSNLIEKTSRKARIHKFNYHMALGNFEVRFRKVISIAFILIFIGVCFLQATTSITYTLNKESKMDDIFIPDNTIVLVYENKDTEIISSLADELVKEEKVKTITSYSTTLGKKYTSEELSVIISNMNTGFEITPDLLNIIYYDYFKGNEVISLSLKEFVDFINENVVNNIVFSQYLDTNTITQIEMMQNFTDINIIKTPLTANLMASTIGMNEIQINQLYMMRYGPTYTSESSMSIYDFVNFVITDVLSNEMYASQFDTNTIKKLYTFKSIMDAVISDTKYSKEILGELLSNITTDLNPEVISLLYMYYGSIEYNDLNQKLSIDTLFDYLTNELFNDNRFKNLITDDMRIMINKNKAEIDGAIAMLKGERYSRLIMTTSLPDESQQTTSFIDTLDDEYTNQLTGEYYLVGNSVMVYEMEKSFNSEFIFITILTALAIFIVVAFTSRSLIIPLILVLLVQCGVFITISIIGIQGSSIYYLALLIVECILMGSTIDYGILFTNNYREKRKTLSTKEALIETYHVSTPTILTSGSIMIFVTAIAGRFFGNPTIEEIVSTVSIGCLSAVLLILFVLPAIITTVDKFVYKEKK